MALSPANRVRLLDIARVALLKKLAGERVSSSHPSEPVVEDPDLMLPSGCFVSLHEWSTHRLRGCVGRIDPQLPLWEAVFKTAQDVLHDPRFLNRPVSIAEVADLEIEVSVLSPPREAGSPLEFDLLNSGIYLTHGKRSGFFLPQVARETGWTREQLLERLCTEKLGMKADAWRDPEAKLCTFSVEVVGPEKV